MSDIRVKRPPECVTECSADGHEFGPDGYGEIITTAYGWSVYRCDEHTDDPTDPNVEVVEASYQKDAWGDFPENFLCRCCQHVLSEVEEPAPAHSDR